MILRDRRYLGLRIKNVLINPLYFVISLISFLVNFRRLPRRKSYEIYDYLFWYKFENVVRKSYYADKVKVKCLVNEYIEVIDDKAKDKIWKGRTVSGLVSLSPVQRRISFKRVLRSKEPHYALIPPEYYSEDYIDLDIYEEVKYYVFRKRMFMFHVLKRGTNIRAFYNDKGQFIRDFMWAPVSKGKYLREIPNDIVQEREDLYKLFHTLNDLVCSLDFEFYRLDIYYDRKNNKTLFGEITFHPGGGIEVCTDPVALREMMYAKT